MRALLLAILLAVVFTSCHSGSDSSVRAIEGPNVLFIVVDDLRPDMIGALGGTGITPNLDRLVGSGATFTRAYCQQAICNPSRASFLTGRRPESLGIFDLDRTLTATAPDVVTLPQHFKSLGYRTMGIGKVFHHEEDRPESWSEPAQRPVADNWHSPANRMLIRQKELRAQGAGVSEDALRRASLGPPTERSLTLDEDHFDGQVAAEALRTLESLAVDPRPFFLAVGFSRPHLPFNAPAPYWDLYDPNLLPEPWPVEPPLGSPAIASTNFPELRAYDGMPGSKLPEPWLATQPISDAEGRQLRHGYLAATSFVDAQIGKLLDKLDALELTEDTIVVILSDHGFKLGELGGWTKHTNYELDVRSALILRVPGRTPLPPILSFGAETDAPPEHRAVPGQRIEALVELVDVFPTLCELAELPTPGGLEGISFAPLLSDPEQPWKSAAFSLYPRGELDPTGVVGRTIRTRDHRLTVWRTEQGSVLGRELYDYRFDPIEVQNLADDPRYAEVAADLTQRLWGGWREALPPR
ncbi:MAG: sulfatase [Planctomycetota bacterium]